MRIKSFKGSNLSAVMADVRRDMGADALIVSSYEEDGWVYVTAALEGKENTPNPMTQESQHQPPQLKTNWQEKILKKWSEFLSWHRVPHTIAEKILSRMEVIGAMVSQSSHQKVHEEDFLEKLFHFSTLDGEKSRGMDQEKEKNRKPWILVGPPGAGKSLTAAKLALHAKWAGQSVALVNGDTEKSTSFEQLAAYAEAIQVPCYDIKKWRQANPPACQFLIDTTGSNPFDPKEQSHLKEFIQETEGKPLFILPAGMDVYEALDMADAYERLGVRHFAMTKGDISRRLGSLLGLLAYQRLSFSYMTQGPFLADLVQEATPSVLNHLLESKNQEGDFQGSYDQDTRILLQKGAHS